MKRRLKLRATDNLEPIKNQIMDLIDLNATAIEFGCGNGDLLFKLSPRIKYGLGIDKSKTLIDNAIKQKEQKNITNIAFLCKALGANYKHSETYDFSIASLFFHVVPVAESIYLLNKMQEISDNILICGFSCPETLQHKSLLWLDQRFSNHYKNFKAYQKFGYLEGILAETRCSIITSYNTFIPFIKIYRIS
ncbi:class I SAM-dependent methyltransferase [Olivibacter sp. SDN3]|uniref:class I SAM-dependent methyltransferase n=1 Tax=Olivibacter sp. SDN3 TaxID=2764720 RepID=UPI0016514C04|nr:class I SAM-dependent methyltransferase [Olivibacter sp. SDN3]QNL48047.1 class I SAM-dependent methyltransferase [Olivibacter sp. SDN3]